MIRKQLAPLTAFPLKCIWQNFEIALLLNEIYVYIAMSLGLTQSLKLWERVVSCVLGHIRLLRMGLSYQFRRRLIWSEILSSILLEFKFIGVLQASCASFPQLVYVFYDNDSWIDRAPLPRARGRVLSCALGVCKIILDGVVISNLKVWFDIENSRFLFKTQKWSEGNRPLEFGGKGRKLCPECI